MNKLLNYVVSSALILMPFYALAVKKPKPEDGVLFEHAAASHKSSPQQAAKSFNPEEDKIDDSKEIESGLTQGVIDYFLRQGAANDTSWTRKINFT